MSLHKARGASLVEYALLLVIFAGGTAAAAKGAGVVVRDAFAESADEALSVQRSQAELGSPADGVRR